MKKYCSLQERRRNGPFIRPGTFGNRCGILQHFGYIPGDSGKSEGTEVGVREGEHLQKPMFTASGETDVEAVIRWLDSLPDELDLSIGGPRASECLNAYEVARTLLGAVLSKIR